MLSFPIGDCPAKRCHGRCGRSRRRRERSMTDIRPRRSLLYMPGANARAIDKARTLPADGIIIDLEDAVAPDAKEAARAQVLSAVRQGGFGHREVVIRVNGPDTPWSEGDIPAAAEAGA